MLPTFDFEWPAFGMTAMNVVMTRATIVYHSTPVATMTCICKTIKALWWSLYGSNQCHRGRSSLPTLKRISLWAWIMVTIQIVTIYWISDNSWKGSWLLLYSSSNDCLVCVPILLLKYFTFIFCVCKSNGFCNCWVPSLWIYFCVHHCID